MNRIPPRRIVAAFDASEPATAALRAAVGIARATDAELEVVYAEAPALAVPYPYDGLDGAAAKAVADEARRFKVEWRGKARAELKGLRRGRARLVWLTGWSPDAILDRVRERRADLLVAGTHGRAGLSRLVLGSVAEGLVRRSPVPVLCVHDGDSMEGGILAPYNLQTYSDPALLFALDLAVATGRRLTVLRVCGAGEPDAQDELAQAVRLEASFGERALPEIEYRVRRGEPRAAIAAEAARGGYGLVVLSPHVGGLSGMTFGGTAERLLRRVRVPVLAVPAEAEAQGGRRGPAARGKARARRDAGRRSRGRAWKAASR